MTVDPPADRRVRLRLGDAELQARCAGAPEATPCEAWFQLDRARADAADALLHPVRHDRVPLGAGLVPRLEAEGTVVALVVRNEGDVPWTITAQAGAERDPRLELAVYDGDALLPTLLTQQLSGPGVRVEVAPGAEVRVASADVARRVRLEPGRTYWAVLGFPTVVDRGEAEAQPGSRWDATFGGEAAITAAEDGR